MTTCEHFVETEKLLDQVNEITHKVAYLNDMDDRKVHRLLAQAQVHAILACVPSYNL